MPDQPIAFLFSYVRRRPWQFGLLMTLVVLAACCSVGVQYGMKLIVDDMAEGDRGSQTIWRLLTLFIGLTATESVLWRLAGWLGCLTVVATGVSVRLDIFKHLTGHPMHYFSTHMSGALGNRVTATASAVAAVMGSVIWHIVPPCVDFIGAVVVLISIDPRMALALVVFAGAVGIFINRFGSRGRPLHQAFAEKASLSGGEVVDVVSNIWTVKAFSARDREYRRLQNAFGIEARAQRRSWLYTEKARVLHDICLLIMAGGMLIWAIHSWRTGASSPGDVVVISALTFRILHGSRDLALSAVEASRQLGIMRDMLRVVAVAHQVVDKPQAPRFVPGRGAITLQNVVFSYGLPPPVLHDFSLHIPPFGSIPI
ncbi:MAG: transporter related protein [Rhizobacter sp.]|nr:transporter related protein [Rhizobacter sp.]